MGPGTCGGSVPWGPKTAVHRKPGDKRMKRLWTTPRALVGSMAMLMLSSVPTLAQANADVEKNIANSKNWATQAGDMYNQRYSKLSQINTRNVGKMQVAWT